MELSMDSAVRVALVHDQIEQDGGAERVLWTFHKMFPTAPIFTAMWNRSRMPRFESCDVRTSWLQRLPAIKRVPRAYAALYPLAFIGLDLSDFDLVISSSTSFAKGIRTGKSTAHISYCYSPANFLWRPNAYFTRPISRVVTFPVRLWLKTWDRWAARQPDVYIAISQAVADRVRRFYQREPAILHPPVDPSWFVGHKSDEFYLVVSRLVEPKRVELAVDAAGQLGVPLWVVGEGRAAAALKQKARDNVRFLGRVADSELRDLYTRAIAVVVPGEEDFGIVPVEAQAAGTPVVAYDAGGARETVIEGVTGLRFQPQTVDALSNAMAAVRRPWDRARLRANAARFAEPHFCTELMAIIQHHRAVVMEAPMPEAQETRAN
jgi:glycosyltransferase involved in cell wall biosynthesis